MLAGARLAEWRSILKFINLTRRTEIGANCYYLGSGEQGVVLDCGMHPKEEGEAALPLSGPSLANRSMRCCFPTRISITSARFRC